MISTKIRIEKVRTDHIFERILSQWTIVINKIFNLFSAHQNIKLVLDSKGLFLFHGFGSVLQSFLEVIHPALLLRELKPTSLFSIPHDYFFPT